MSVNNMIPKQLDNPLHSVVKSFTAEQVVNELKDCETIDDAIRYFEDMNVKIMEIETIVLEKETAKDLHLLIINLIMGKQLYYKKQKDALKVLESKIV